MQVEIQFSVKCTKTGATRILINSEQSPELFRDINDKMHFKYHVHWKGSFDVCENSGYMHDSCADKNLYPHDCCADKDSYPHDRNIQCLIL